LFALTEYPTLLIKIEIVLPNELKVQDYLNISLSNPDTFATGIGIHTKLDNL